ncbi:MAG: MAPEG family protein, partial [Prochlorococcus sp.]
RFGNPAEDPTRVLASSHSMEVDLHVLANTHEQLSIFIINVMALSILLPFPYLTLLPIYSGIFIFGRLVFWLGYRHNPLLRAPGFALNILPALAGLIYCAIALIWLSD